jgi:hypothetical protein
MRGDADPDVVARQRAAARLLADFLEAQRRLAGDEVIAGALDLLAANSGQNAFRHAAQAVRGAARPGRRAIDDRAAIRRIEQYPEAMRREAVGIVAGQIAGSGADKADVDAIAHRLRRKLKRTKWMCPPLSPTIEKA